MKKVIIGILMKILFSFIEVSEDVFDAVGYKAGELLNDLWTKDRPKVEKCIQSLTTGFKRGISKD